MTLRINGKTYEAGKLVAYVEKLEKENARLKDGIALKDEEIGCVETDFNTFKSKAKEIIKELMNNMGMSISNYDAEKQHDSYRKAKQFLKEIDE